MIHYDQWSKIWTGEKPLSSLFFYTEDWPPDMPTWGIPPLEEKGNINSKLEALSGDVTEWTSKLGAFISAEDGVDGYTYTTQDLASELKNILRDIPEEYIAEEKGIPSIAMFYYDCWLRGEDAKDSLTYEYFQTPSGQRYDYREANPTVDVALFFWSHVTTLQGDEKEIERRKQLILQLIGKYGIPSSGIKGYEKIFGSTSGMPSWGETETPSWGEGETTPEFPTWGK